MPLPSPTTLTGGGCGGAGFGRADYGKGGDPLFATACTTPVVGVSAIEQRTAPTDPAHPVPGTDDPAVQPD
jgi:hypothetical protein